MSSHTTRDGRGAPPLGKTALDRLTILETWVRSRLSAAEFCRIVAVAPSQLYAWRKSFEESGPAGLEPRKKGSPKGSRLPEPTRRSVWSMFWSSLKDRTLIVLSCAALLAIGVELVQARIDPEYVAQFFDGIGILVAVLVASVVTTANEAKAAREFAALERERANVPVKVLRGGEVRQLSIFEIVVGDLTLTGRVVDVPGGVVLVDIASAGFNGSQGVNTFVAPGVVLSVEVPRIASNYTIVVADADGPSTWTVDGIEIAATPSTSSSVCGAMAKIEVRRGFPSVRVPVLSTTSVSTFSRRSSASAFLISTPCSAPRPVPTMIDIGVARPRAHGQAMMSTATAATTACASRGSGPTSHQTTAVTSATVPVGSNATPNVSNPAAMESTTARDAASMT